MQLNRNGSNWSALELNKTNENWDIIEEETTSLGNKVGNIIGEITDEAVEKVIDSAKLNWKEPVDTVADLPEEADEGDTRMVREVDPDGLSYVYRYDGENWEKIQAIDVTLVNEVDGRLTSQLVQTKDEIYERGINVKKPPIPLVGVKNDGTDEKETINNIIEYAHANAIEVIMFPDGEYTVHPGSYASAPTANHGGIAFKDNIKLILSSQAIIRALPSDGGGYNIIRGFRNKNIGIIGGIIIGDRNNHIGTSGEWGHGINLRGCENVVIETAVNDCWGDGVYLGGGGSEYPCKNIYIKRLETNNNRRQGVSLTYVDGFYFDQLILNDTNGTAPSAGMDIEPNANEFVKNGFINSIYAEGNEGAGVQFYAERDGAIIDDILIDKIITKNNRDGIWYREKNLKGVKINIVESKGNVRDGFRVNDGATGLVVGILIAEDNAARGLGISGSGGNVFKYVKTINNGATGFEFSGGTGENLIEMLEVVCSETSDYGIAGYSSNRMKIGKAIVDNPNLSGLFLNNVNDSDITVEVRNSKGYPIRLNNSHNNKINNSFINEPLFTQPNALSLMRLEGGSSENEITNTSSKVTGNKARYAVQYVESSHNNFVGFNNFKGTYMTDMISDPNSANNSMYNFPNQ